MPRGNPSKQTLRTTRYQVKAGYISKAYKLKQDTVERFARACETAGISQSAKLTELMNSFAEEHENGMKERG